MRDTQHGVDLSDGPWPASVIRDLPVGVLEIDALGRALRENATLARLLSAGSARTTGPGEDAVMVADRWPQLVEATEAVLSGRPVDTLLTSARTVLRVRGVPRCTGGRPDGGLIVVSDAVEGRRAVVDVREGPFVDVAGAAGAELAPSEAPRRAAPGWRRRAGAAGRRRHPAGRADEHAATHDPLTGLANQVLVLQCLTDALASCRLDRRVGVLVVEVPPAPDDAPLHEMAALLTQLAGPHDLAGRLRGGRFVLVLRDVRAGADVRGFLARTFEPLRRAEPGSPAGRNLRPDGVAMVLADPVSGAAADRDPRLVLAMAFEALERSRAAGHPVVGTELPADAEQARLAALWSYDVHDLALDDVLHGITEVAVGTCDAAIALVTFVDRDLQWVRAATGVRLEGLLDGRGPRHLTLCDRTIRGRDVLVVPDTEQDPEFTQSRHVGWQVGMRFYAGAPLITPEGRAVGTLCVFDVMPRDLTERQRRSLAVLAEETVAALEAHRLRA